MPEIIYDPIHTIIPFSDREKRVIDHAFLQRLRFIHQLGLKWLVYPGAVHDRFSHALGAMHMAGRVFDAINNTSDVFKKLKPRTREYIQSILRLAGLLHDVGHGPFSHASENLMPKLGALAIPEDWYETYSATTQATHEDFGVLLIRTLGSVKEKILTSIEAQDIASLVHKHVIPSQSWSEKFSSVQEASGYHLFLKRLISGELDVDRMDYLLRDAHFTGVSYGVYDLPWLLHSMSATMTGTGPKLVLHERGVHAFEDFLFSRYQMFIQVYFHRTTAMFERYVEEAIKQKEITLIIPSDAYEYTRLRDATVLEAMFIAARDPANTWSCRLEHRESARLLFDADRSDPARGRRYQLLVKTLRDTDIPYLERDAHKSLSEEPILKSGAAGILVARKYLDKTEYVPIEDVSLLLKHYNAKVDRHYLYVFREDYARALRALHKLKEVR